jgi:hypothetical protein
VSASHRSASHPARTGSRSLARRAVRGRRPAACCKRPLAVHQRHTRQSRRLRCGRAPSIIAKCLPRSRRCARKGAVVRAEARLLVRGAVEKLARSVRDTAPVIGGGGRGCGTPRCCRRPLLIKEGTLSGTRGRVIGGARIGHKYDEWGRIIARYRTAKHINDGLAAAHAAGGILLVKHPPQHDSRLCSVVHRAAIAPTTRCKKNRGRDEGLAIGGGRLRRRRRGEPLGLAASPKNVKHRASTAQWC